MHREKIYLNSSIIQASGLRRLLFDKGLGMILKQVEPHGKDFGLTHVDRNKSSGYSYNKIVDIAIFLKSTLEIVPNCVFPMVSEWYHLSDSQKDASV